MDERKTAANRSLIVIAAAAGVLMLYLLRMVYLQLVNNEKYLEKATKTSSYTRTITAARGEVVDRYGRSIATNTTCYNVIVDKLLLNDADLKIGEIARSVGFEDPLYFSRRFCQTLGVSPSAYRRAHGAGLDLEPDLMYNNNTKPEKEKTT